MTASPMSAREALEIVRDGPIPTRERWAQATAILTALVEAHEVKCAEWDAIPNLPSAIKLFYAVRALERGEDAPRV